MIKQTERVPIVPLLVLQFVALTAVQWWVPPGPYTTFSIACMFVVFTFKSWVNLVCAVTMYRQHGTSDLARAVQAYFWSLLGQSGMLAFLYFDAMGLSVPGLDLAEVRNTIRNVAIVSVLAVIIYGSRMLDALFDHLRSQQARGESP